MQGPFELHVSEINRRADNLRPGVYTLGVYEGEEFRVNRVGRFSANMTGNLYRWLGLYSHFQYKLLPDARSAFSEECRLWHESGGEKGVLDSTSHPQGLSGLPQECPICGLVV